MDLELEILEYGDQVELANGDICVYIRKELDDEYLQSCELNLVNIFTGEEHSINCYKDDLTHDADAELSVKRFVS